MLLQDLLLPRSEHARSLNIFFKDRIPDIGDAPNLRIRISLPLSLRPQIHDELHPVLFPESLDILLRRLAELPAFEQSLLPDFPAVRSQNPSQISGVPHSL